MSWKQLFQQFHSPTTNWRCGSNAWERITKWTNFVMSVRRDASITAGGGFTSHYILSMSRSEGNVGCSLNVLCHLNGSLLNYSPNPVGEIHVHSVWPSFDRNSHCIQNFKLLILDVKNILVHTVERRFW